MIFYIKPSEQELNERKLESYLNYSKIIQWGRQNPTRFMERFMGIILTDYQNYIFLNSWTKNQIVWCISRNGGKSFISAPFVMTKSILFPKFQAYIMAGGAGRQAQETFRKIEQITKKEIASAIGYTDFFSGEIEINNNNKTGFVHDPASWQYRTFAGGKVNTLNSNFDNNRGFRSNLNIYDESGFSSDELFETSMPFLTQNSNFIVGADVDVSTIPKNLPNQALFISSASNMSTYYYKKYKELGKRMICGDKSVFVADIDAKMVIDATIKGKLPNQPLLEQSLIDNEMRINKSKAMREFFNQFDKDGGEQQPFKRSIIEKYSFPCKPTLKNNNDENCSYVLAYDPARSHDNSIFGIGKLYEDEELGYKMDIVNIISFNDIAKKKKTPMDFLKQRQEIRDILVKYNGDYVADYENIELFMVDQGAGGAGVQMVDMLAENFKDSKNRQHFGIIDKAHRENDLADGVTVKHSYPDAKDIVKFMSPKKYKVEMYDSLSEMINYGYLRFPQDYDGKDTLTFYDLKKLDEPIEIIDDETGEVTYSEYEEITRVEELTFDEKLSLTQINLAKEELYNMYIYNGLNGSYRYDLAPDKKTENDDRADVVAMLGWYLKQKRKKAFVRAGATEIDYSNIPICVSTIELKP